MAPPSSRRSSSSRRAQYGVFTGYVVASVGALIGAALLLLSLVRADSFSGLRSLTADVVEPVGQGTAAARVETQSIFERISGFWNAGKKNAALKQEVELARIKLAEGRAVARENARLKALVDLRDTEDDPVAVTRLVGSSSVSSRRFGYIGAGRVDGVEIGMPVRSARGVIGRILETGARTSRVLLLTDSQSVLPVRLAATDRDVVALAEGRGDGLLRIRLINLGINPLRKGDVMVTSGSGGYYRPGIAVAVIVEINDEGGLARMISDPMATNYVAVEEIWHPEAVEAAQSPPDEPFTDSEGEDAAEGEAQTDQPVQPEEQQ